MSDKTIEKVVRIPKELDKYKGGINFALYNLALGKKPKGVLSNSGQIKQTKLVLSEKGYSYFQELDEGSMQKTFSLALLWLSEQSNHVVLTKI